MKDGCLEVRILKDGFTMTKMIRINNLNGYFNPQILMPK